MTETIYSLKSLRMSLTLLIMYSVLVSGYMWEIVSLWIENTMRTMPIGDRGTLRLAVSWELLSMSNRTR
jgi:hypothetical protein